MINEAFGWIWIVLGLLAGIPLGLGSAREDWLGGYASPPRRMLRLGHISFVMLGILNILFALEAARLGLTPALLATASSALVAGAVAMPLCCGLAAWRPSLRSLFPLPVLTLITGGGLTAAGMVLS